MAARIGIDVGGTFTDFILTRDGAPPVLHKVLSTPADPSIAVVAGLAELAAMVDPAQGVEAFAASIETIVHGTTVATNATLTATGAKSALLTTEGVRDALEMRRGIRERQYDNTYTNVKPLVPRHLRVGVKGRLDRAGRELEPLSLADVESALERFRQEGVEAVSICFMNSFANPAHEAAAAALVRAGMPDAFLTVSSTLLPAIRFYERLSTTALNSYVGPRLNRYLEQLVAPPRRHRLPRPAARHAEQRGGDGAGGRAREPRADAAVGPAGGPGAGLFYARALGQDRAITTDMGGTSFEASVAVGAPILVNDGEIARHKIALPMLDIHTIGAGGGSIGWLDAGGLLRMGPQSAGADPGPACYGSGGTLPTVDRRQPGARLPRPRVLRRRAHAAVAWRAARDAIAAHIAEPMGLDRRGGRGRHVPRGLQQHGAGRARGDRSSAATTRASSRSSPPAAPGPSTPARSATSSRSRCRSCRASPRCCARWECCCPTCSTISSAPSSPGWRRSTGRGSRRWSTPWSAKASGSSRPSASRRRRGGTR